MCICVFVVEMHSCVSKVCYIFMLVFEVVICAVLVVVMYFVYDMC